MGNSKTPDSLNLRLSRYERKRLYAVTLGAFVSAQDGFCPLCGTKDYWAPTQVPLGEGRKGWPGSKLDRNENFYTPTFDHVTPHKAIYLASGKPWPTGRVSAFDMETMTGGIMGNCLVVHSGCNNRKGAAMPLPHELAVLNVVNERLGWDGHVYTNTADRENYERLLHSLKYAGWDRMIDMHGDVVINAALAVGSRSASGSECPDYPRQREPFSLYRPDQDRPPQTGEMILSARPRLGPYLPRRQWSSYRTPKHQTPSP